MDLVPALGLVGLLLVKEAGIPIPVPGDLLVIGAGVAAAGTGIGALILLLAILAAGYVGGTLQFLLVRLPPPRPRKSVAEVGDPRGGNHDFIGRLRASLAGEPVEREQHGTEREELQ